MNQENKLEQIASSAGEYLAPKIKVKELRCRRVLCQSDGGTNKMNFENELGDGDFE